MIRSLEDIVQPVDLRVQAIAFLLMLLGVGLYRIIQLANIRVGIIQLLLLLGQLSHQILAGLVARGVRAEQPSDFVFQVFDFHVPGRDLAVFTLDHEIFFSELLLHGHEVVVEVFELVLENGKLRIIILFDFGNLLLCDLLFRAFCLFDHLPHLVLHLVFQQSLVLLGFRLQSVFRVHFLL